MDELGQLIRLHSIQHGDFILASGLHSRYYFDGKKVTLSPRGSWLIGYLFFDRLKDLNIDAVGGMVTGADPISIAIAIVSQLEGKPIPAFMVREQRKKHGLRNQLYQANSMDGVGDVIAKGRRVVVVDDVATTGQSCMDAIEVVEAAGATVVKVIVLVDRQQGAAERFKKHKAHGLPFEALFVADADGSLSEWKPPLPS